MSLTWKLRSNSGADTLACDIEKLVIKRERIAGCRIAVTSTSEHQVELDQVPIETSRLELLLASLRLWMLDRTPMALHAMSQTLGPDGSIVELP